MAPTFVVLFLIFPSFAFSSISNPTIEQHAEAGQTAILNCPSSDGATWDRISWEMTDGRFLAAGPTYRIVGVTEGHSGIYICRKLRFRSQFQGVRSITIRVRLVVDPAKPKTTERAPTSSPEERSSDSRVPNRVVGGSPPPSLCTPNQVACGFAGDPLRAPTRPCILKDWMCDGEDDCDNNWDEQGCSDIDNCRPQTYQCKTSKSLIPMGYRCDGEADCQGMDDEKDCTPPTFLTPAHIGRVEQISSPLRTFAPVRLTCVAQGQPKPTVIWRHNGRGVTGEHEVEETCEARNDSTPVIVRSTLVLFTRMSDQGFYTCEATSGNGRAFSSDFLLRFV